jgi:hypothetical protein
VRSAHSLISSRLRKTISARQNFAGLHVRNTRRTSLQDAQKGQTSHPPNPGAPRRALSQARPQRVKGRGGTYRTSCGPFALTMGLGERKSPSSISYFRETPPPRGGSERCENAAGGLFQLPVRTGSPAQTLAGVSVRNEYFTLLPSVIVVE